MAASLLPRALAALLLLRTPPPFTASMGSIREDRLMTRGCRGLLMFLLVIAMSEALTLGRPSAQIGGELAAISRVLLATA
jgi:hypothetical protein